MISFIFSFGNSLNASSGTSDTHTDNQVPSSSTSTVTNRVHELQNLVEDLLDQQATELKVPTSLQEALETLKKSLTSEFKTFKVETEDILGDTFAYYKDSAFDASVQLRIRYKLQPAVDTGGVSRQFFTDVFNQLLIGGSGIPALFEGPTGRKMPIQNAAITISGIMNLVGKIISHSIVLTGIGPAFFSPTVYKYICSGDLNSTIPLISVEDATTRTRHYIDLVRLFVCTTIVFTYTKNERVYEYQNLTY